MKLKAPAFAAAANVPVRFTCDGSNVSPALGWTDAPPTAKSFVLIMDDPDAPRRTWVHWILFDVPSIETHLAEGIPSQGKLPSGARQGQNDFGRIGYGGPCPPPGPPHRYYFRLFALDRTIDLDSGASRAQVERAMRGHVLASTELMARYARGSSE